MECFFDDLEINDYTIMSTKPFKLKNIFIRFFYEDWVLIQNK